MRIAIATFGSEVSPRFCFSREVLVADLEDQHDRGTPVALGAVGYPERLRLLESLRVGLLVCGGFQRAFLPIAERAGIHVIWGIAGPVEAALADARAGRLIAPTGGRGCWCRATGPCQGKRTRHRGGTTREEEVHVRNKGRRGRM